MRADQQVLAHRQVGEDAAALGHVDDAEAHDRVRPQRADRLAVEPDAAAAGPHQAADRAQQRGLARAVGAEDADQLAALDPQRHLLQRADRAVVDREAVDLKHRRHLAEIGQQHPRIVQHLAGRAFGDHLAGIEHDGAVAEAPHQPHVVLDQQDRQAALAAQCEHQVREVLDLAFVEAGDRLVEQQVARAHQDHAAELEQLAVAIGKAAGACRGCARCRAAPRRRRLRARARLLGARLTAGVPIISATTE